MKTHTQRKCHRVPLPASSFVYFVGAENLNFIPQHPKRIFKKRKTHAFGRCVNRVPVAWHAVVGGVFLLCFVFVFPPKATYTNGAVLCETPEEGNAHGLRICFCPLLYTTLFLQNLTLCDIYSIFVVIFLSLFFPPVSALTSLRVVRFSESRCAGVRLGSRTYTRHIQ
ncbi:hypothetical protein ABB37_08101 [Leptomonas pyrrhocoris]|uniref:Transmembrane protein n=1 Tax=Leptomonas pyrrhocoris TaxID=157538 RepID=A0A0N0DSD5_LEPPY|nr:hypothetical protein ABB37_08101 [Leptomonas pyrrhocoris]KPA75938.1 hypothetical protein ABB37_08101 [Leptomonas pyrrhocoris]|eukprot:XP_015654377.1 hypothetical protein ABB37_08101 [Leptomonas pyrrhocoris]